MSMHLCKPFEGMIAAPCGELEVVVTCPRHVSGGDYPLAYAIVCHPHPLQGGTMHNKVVYMLNSAFNQLGVGSVRFNFRGVGKSTGQFDHGLGETEDLRAVLKWVKQQYVPREIWLAGFSFGSYVALRAHREMGAARLLLVAPAVGRFDFESLSLSDVPTLVVQGGKDEVIEPLAVSDWVAKQTHEPDFRWLPKADHFFHGQLNELREHVFAVWGAEKGKK